MQQVFRGSQGLSCATGEPSRQAFGTLLKFIVGDDPRQQAPLQGFLSRQHSVRKGQVHGPSQPHQPCEEVGRSTIGRQACFGIRHRQLGGFPGDSQVAGNREAETAACGEPLDRAHNRGGLPDQARDRGVQVRRQLFEVAREVVPLGSEQLQVPSPAEPRAFASNQNRSDIRIFIALDRRHHERLGYIGVDGVGGIRSVEYDVPDIVADGELYGGRFHSLSLAEFATPSASRWWNCLGLNSRGKGLLCVDRMLHLLASIAILLVES